MKIRREPSSCIMRKFNCIIFASMLIEALQCLSNVWKRTVLAKTFERHGVKYGDFADILTTSLFSGITASGVL